MSRRIACAIATSYGVWPLGSANRPVRCHVSDGSYLSQDGRSAWPLSDQAVDGNSERSCDASQSFEGGILTNSALDLREIRLGESSSFGQLALTKLSSLAERLHSFPRFRSPSRASSLSSHYAEAMERRIARRARPRGRRPGAGMRE